MKLGDELRSVAGPNAVEADGGERLAKSILGIGSLVPRAAPCPARGITRGITLPEGSSERTLQSNATSIFRTMANRD